MGWRKWAKVETVTGVLIFITAWPLSTCRLLVLIVLGGLFAIAYRKRANGQAFEHARAMVRERINKGR